VACARRVCNRCARATNGEARSHRVHIFKLFKTFIKGGSTGSADTAEGVKKRTCGKTTAEASTLPAGCLDPPAALVCFSWRRLLNMFSSESAYVLGS